MTLMEAFVEAKTKAFITDLVFGFPHGAKYQIGYGSLVRLKDLSLKVIVEPETCLWAYREVLYNPDMESVKQVTVKGDSGLWSAWCAQMGLEEPPGTFEQVLRRLDE